MIKKAILVVSFGTSHKDTREKTINAIENDIAKKYSDYEIYTAWTSKIIMKILLKRDNIKINNVKEAMEKMIIDGVTDLIVQPTHVINGIENDLMKEEVLSFSDKFSSISFGDPLLTSHEDTSYVVETIANEFADVNSDTAVVLMGHGTEHYVNSAYPALDYQFKQSGHKNIFVGTVEGYPELDDVLNYVKECDYKKVLLSPFMIVAGDHAKNDLAGDDEDSWKSEFIKAGFEVECRLKGLGEYKKIRQLFVSHINDKLK